MSSSSRRITSDGAFLRAVANVAGGDFEPAPAAAVRSRLSASIDAFDRAVARLKHEGFLVKATDYKTLKLTRLGADEAKRTAKV